MQQVGLICILCSGETAETMSIKNISYFCTLPSTTVCACFKPNNIMQLGSERCIWCC